MKSQLNISVILTSFNILVGMLLDPTDRFELSEANIFILIY